MVNDDSRYRDDPYRTGTSDPSSVDDRATAQFPSSSYSPSGYPKSASGTTDGTSSHGRRSSGQVHLDDVFDDPDHGDPGRDRMAPHVLWELVLALGVGGIAFLLYRVRPELFKGAGLTELMLFSTIVGLLAMGMGLSLRAAVPNLAVGPIAYASAVLYAGHADRGSLYSAAATALLAAGVGVAMAVLVVGFNVPAWAGSLAAAFGLIAWIEQHTVPLRVAGGYRPDSHAVYWLAGFVVLAVFGNLLATIKPLRRMLGRFRPIADPARRRAGAAGLIAALSLVGSCVLASAGGLLLAVTADKLTPANSAFTLTGAVSLTGLALGAALLAGTSAFGRRGGVFGTVLAVTLIVLGGRYLDTTRWDVPPLTLAATAIVAGLLATRLVEAYGRPESAFDVDDWAPSIGASAAGLTASSTMRSEPMRRSDDMNNTTPSTAPVDDRWDTKGHWGLIQRAD